MAPAPVAIPFAPGCSDSAGGSRQSLPVVLFRRHWPRNHVRGHRHDAAVLTCKATDLLLRECSRTSVVCSRPPRQAIGALLSFLDRAHATVDRLRAAVR